MGFGSRAHGRAPNVCGRFIGQRHGTAWRRELSSAAGGAAAISQTSASDANPGAYFTDLLFRSERPRAEADDASVHAEVGRILAMGLAKGEVNPGDRAYLGTLVAARTGLAPPKAEKRVNEVLSPDEGGRNNRARGSRNRSQGGRLYIIVDFLIVVDRRLLRELCGDYRRSASGITFGLAPHRRLRRRPLLCRRGLCVRFYFGS